MSADSFFLFIGLRFEVAENEAEAVETRTDPRVVAARKKGISCRYVAREGSRWLYIGHVLGDLGRENKSLVDYERIELNEIFDRVTNRLQQAGFAGTPRLHAQFEEDN